MLLSAAKTKHPHHDPKTELQRKIKLLEAEKSAFYESSQSTITKSRETILQLREDNKELRRQLGEAHSRDEHIIREAFHHRGQEKEAFRNMTVETVLSKLDEQVLSKMKQRNALKHTSQTYQQQLSELQKEYERLMPGHSGGGMSSDALESKREEDEMRLRDLENRLEKTHFKHKEAENDVIFYLKLKQQMQDESLTFSTQLDGLETEIQKKREELLNLREKSAVAQLIKDSVQAELQHQEALLSKEHKERDRILEAHRKQMEALKAQVEKVDRKVQKTALQPDELANEINRSMTVTATEEDKPVSPFEEALRRIKEATGLSDMQEIVERFRSQKDTHQQLVELKEQNEEVLLQLKEQRELLKLQLEEMKYSGEAKLFSKQQALEEVQNQLTVEQERCQEAKERLNKLNRTLAAVKPRIEHLAEKLQHILLSPEPADPHPDPDQFMLQLLHQCELKLQVLQKELEGKDLTSVMKEMKEDEFYVKIEEKLPEYNTRVKLPGDDQSLELGDKERESKDDDRDVMSREALKHQSQIIIKANSKNNPWEKK